MIYFDIKKYSHGFFINYISDNFFTKTEKTCKEYFAKFNIKREEINDYFKSKLQLTIIESDELAQKILPGCFEYAKEEIDIKLDKILKEKTSCSEVERRSREIQAKESVKTLEGNYNSVSLAKIARFKEIDVDSLISSISSKARAEADIIMHLKACSIYLKNLVSKFTSFDEYIDLDLDKEISNFEKKANIISCIEASVKRTPIIKEKDIDRDLADSSDPIRKIKNLKTIQQRK